MTAVFEKILEMSLTAAVIIVVVLLIRLLLRKAPRKYAYALWSVAAFRLVCPVSFQAVFSLFRFTRRVGETQIMQSVMNHVPTVSPGYFDSAPPGTGTPVEIDPDYMFTYPLAPPPQTTASLLERATEIAAVVWLVGLAALLIYGIVSYVRLRGRMNTAVVLEGNVWQSDRVQSPFILGFVRPRIYVPFGLTEGQQRYVLAHERYHLKRLDHIVRPLSFLILAVHWFNPFVWLAYYMMGRDMEMSCDEKVLSGEENIRKEYSITLLSFAANRRFPSPSPLAFGESGVKGRIKNALNWKKPRTWVTIIAIIVCIVVIIVCAADPLEAAQDPEPPAGTGQEILAVWQADLTHDGDDETITLSYDSESMGYPLTVTDQAGTVIWTEEASTFHMGFRGLYLYERGGREYLLRWTPGGWTGSFAYSYEVFSLTQSGEEQVLERNDFSYDTNSPDQILAIDIPGMRAYEAEVNALLADAVVLIDTNEGQMVQGDPEKPVNLLWTSPADQWEAQQQGIKEEQSLRQANTLAVWPLNDLTVTVLKTEDETVYTLDVYGDDYFFWSTELCTQPPSGDTIYLLYEENGTEYLAEFTGTTRQEVGMYSYRVFTVRPESLDVLYENSLYYEAVSEEAVLTVDIEAIRAFEAEVNNLFSRSANVICGVSDGQMFWYPSGSDLVFHWSSYADELEQRRQAILDEM